MRAKQRRAILRLMVGGGMILPVAPAFAMVLPSNTGEWLAGRADLPAGAEVRANAETCLAQAISHEAGREPEEGQEAVAQVVLNRLRSPLYPKTVCGVVFQGSQRRTGCQFTFTCDGSMARQLPAGSWIGALRIAREALNGRLASPIGDATHYHAYYVTPAWSAQLTRIGRIGAHIFYGGVPHGGPIPAARMVASGSRLAAHGAATPRSTIFSAWGLQTAMLIPTAGSVRVQAVAAPEAALDRATPRRAPDMADPSTR